MWTCPRCDRQFGREHRAHVCAPGMPVEVWLDDLPEGQRRAATAVLAIARQQPGVVIEAVSVGVLIKRDRTLVELRPKRKWLDVSFLSTAAIDSPRIARVVRMANGFAYFVHLADEEDVDGVVAKWLVRALK